MSSLALNQFGDLLELTIRDYEKVRYTNLIPRLTRYPAAKQFIRKSRMDSRPQATYEWKARVQTSESYRHISATTPDFFRETDDFTHASITFQKTQTGYSFLQEEMDFNAGPNRIIDLIKAKEDGQEFDWVTGIDADFWAAPSATDTLAFNSLPYWVPKVTGTPGFTGTALTGFTNPGGLSPTTFPQWCSYAGGYTNVSLDDLIDKARSMAELTDFEPVVESMPELGGTRKISHSYYTNLSVKKIFENVADSRNDNLGVDVAKNDNKTMFRNAPIEYVPSLDADTGNPFYQMVWDVFKLVFKTGWWRRRWLVKPVPGQHNQVGCLYDTWHNWACWDRHKLGVLCTSSSYPS